MFELVGDKDHFKEIHYKGNRVGTIWENNRGESITVKINPSFWMTGLKISGESYHHPQEYCIIVQSLESTAKRNEDG